MSNKEYRYEEEATYHVSRDGENLIREEIRNGHHISEMVPNIMMMRPDMDKEEIKEYISECMEVSEGIM